MRKATPLEIAEAREACPSLKRPGAKVRNPGESSELYNCMAWAMGDTRQPWESDCEGCYWPKWAPQNESIEACLIIAAHFNYAVCADGSLEQGQEKLAFYMSCEIPATVEVSHVARQLVDGWWTSKLGTLISIEHETVGELALDYGNRMLFVKRPRKRKGR